jgi:histone-lysine N-methyltransferase SETD1
LKRIDPSGKVVIFDKESYSEVWTDPLPGRDEGLALIGRQVRCCFPKSVLRDGDRPASSRILEGEIVSLVDYENQWLLQREHRRKRQACFTTVEMLVDRNILKELPFLERSEEDVDTSNMAVTEKKRHYFEQVIRGKNNVIVRVNLGDSSRITCAKDETLVAKWVIRKLVKIPESKSTDVSASPLDGPNQNSSENGSGDALVKAQRKKKKELKDAQAAALYLGDGNDPQDQQERNWRWLAGRYDDMILSSTKEYTGCPLDLSFGMVGEVLSVVPTTEAEANGAPTTIATVTLRRMILPEHCASGRLFYHGPFEFFDDADASSCTFEVRVEELVIISRKFERRYNVVNSGQNTGAGLNCPIITQSYSLRSDCNRNLVPLDSTADYKTINDNPAFDLCHRCHKTEDVGTMGHLKARSLERNDDKSHIAGKIERLKSSLVEGQSDDKTQDVGAMEGLQSSLEKQSDGKMICQACQEMIRSSCEANGQCDCRACRSCRDSLQEALFKFHVERAFDDLRRENGTSQNKDTCRPACGICVVCGYTSELRCDSCDMPMHPECAKWDERLGGEKTNGSREGLPGDALANAIPRIRCRACRNGNSLPLDGDCFTNETIASVCSALQILRPCDFDLPSNFMNLKSVPVPSAKPVTLSNSKRGRPPHKRTPKLGAGAGTSKKKQGQLDEVPPVREVQVDREEDNIFVPSCSRLTPYEPSKKHLIVAPKRQSQTDDDSAATPINGGRAATTKPTSRKRAREPDRAVENKSTSRAARANQRRMMKGVAAFGIGLDALAGREQQLRFDRSSIHAWGVFADEGINAGDMIVEYRGELIGNAVAERREKEYEKAMIGSDYMFRIDAFLVCDATKQGNVARFINASCDPNCYTQIITLNGSKRIVIYAKRDIQAGEELCYDYKFPFEFNESKRIKCYCGAQECRGFMNWVRVIY